MKTKEQRYVYFGEYPQTIKADNVEITEIQDERGYYLGTDGYYYAKVISTPYNYHIVVKQDRPSLPMKERETYRLIEREYIFDLYGDKLIFPELEAICFDKLRHIPNVDSYRFSDGRVILPALEYFFKVEPIKWTIISEGTDNSFMLSDYVIDTPTSIMKYLFEMYYEIYRGNGQRIEDAVGNAIAEAKRLAVKDKIRHWAENIFYKTGFSDGELNSIIDDKLVSYKDIELLPDFTTRVPTDYALAKGVQLHGGYYGNACAWWLYGCDYLVYFDGKPRKCTFRPQDYFQVGILPSLKLKKEIDEKEQKKYIKDFNKAIEERKAEAEKWAFEKSDHSFDNKNTKVKKEKKEKMVIIDHNLEDDTKREGLYWGPMQDETEYPSYLMNLIDKEDQEYNLDTEKRSIFLYDDYGEEEIGIYGELSQEDKRIIRRVKKNVNKQ